MSNSHCDVTRKVIYALYDKKDELIFTGTIDEIMGFTSAKKSAIYSAIYRGACLNRKYLVIKVGYEPITEKKCNKCGQVLPLKYMVHRHRPTDGKWVPRSICKACKSEEGIQYRLRKKKEKGE